MAVIKGIKAAVVVASGTSTTFTAEATTANVAKTVYTITDRSKRFWDASAATTVYYNGIANTSYASIQYPGGIVTWAVSPGSSAVTVTGKYLAAAASAQARDWSMDVSYDMADATVFGNTARVQVPILRGATITVNQFYADDTFQALVRAGSLVGWQLYVNYDSGTPANDVYYIGYGYIAGGVSAAVDGLEEEPITITVTDGPYFVSGVA